ncbi:MAG: hypothetical protein AAF602_02650 [Myxococcota bacterium]
MVTVSNSFGTVIRAARASEVGASVADIVEQLGFPPSSIGVGNGVIVVGPVFGEETSRSLTTALERAGLSYYDDFYTFEEPFPEWLTVGASCANDGTLPTTSTKS